MCGALDYSDWTSCDVPQGQDRSMIPTARIVAKNDHLLKGGLLRSSECSTVEK